QPTGFTRRCSSCRRGKPSIRPTLSATSRSLKPSASTTVWQRGIARAASFFAKFLDSPSRSARSTFWVFSQRSPEKLALNRAGKRLPTPPPLEFFERLKTRLLRRLGERLLGVQIDLCLSSARAGREQRCGLSHHADTAPLLCEALRVIVIAPARCRDEPGGSRCGLGLPPLGELLRGSVRRFPIALCEHSLCRRQFRQSQRFCDERDLPLVLRHLTLRILSKPI